MARFMFESFPRATDANGDPVSGAKLYVYEAGTTTPVTTYSDSALTTAQASPVIADAAGYFPQTYIPNGLYKVRMTNADDVLLQEHDRVSQNYAATIDGSPAFRFKDVAALLADTVLGYTGSTQIVTAGDVIETRTEGFAYTVAASGATDEHVTTAGGVKLFVQSNADGHKNVKAFGVKGDSDGASGNGTDDTAALQLAADSNSHIVMPSGIYRVTGSIVFPGDMRIDFEDGAKIYADSGTYSQNYVLVASGSIVQIGDLGSPAVKGEASISFAAAPDLKFDDTLLIYNPSDDSFSANRSYYRAGEFCQVDGVSGTTVSLQAPLYASYNEADVNVYKVAAISVELNNPRIESDGSPLGLVDVDLVRNLQIKKPQMRHKNNSCLNVTRSVGGDVWGGRVVNEGDGGDDYGISVGNSQEITVHGGYWYGRRHGTATGGANVVGSIPCRAINFIGCRIANDRSSSAHAADLHGNQEHCGYYNCHIMGGVSLQGADPSLVDCTVYGDTNFGVAVLCTDVIGGVYRIDGNTFHIFADASASTRRIIDFGGNADAVSSNTVRDLTVSVKNNTFRSSALSGASGIIGIRNRGSDAKINLDCQGNLFDVNNLNTVALVDLISGTASSDFIIVDNNTTTLSTCALMSSDGDYHLLPILRMQSNRWTDDVTTSTSSSVATGSAHTFKWSYPRDPAILAAKQDNTYVGNRVGVALASSLSGTSATLAIASDDATDFSSATAVKLIGDAAIKEV